MPKGTVKRVRLRADPSTALRVTKGGAQGDKGGVEFLRDAEGCVPYGERMRNAEDVVPYGEQEDRIERFLHA